jgi:hypothetical protein
MVPLLAHADTLPNHYSYELVDVVGRRARYVNIAVFWRMLDWSDMIATASQHTVVQDALSFLFCVSCTVLGCQLVFGPILS